MIQGLGNEGKIKGLGKEGTIKGLGNNETIEELQEKPRQRFLVLDTSTAVMAAAVMEERSLLEERNERAERNHSVHVVPVMEQLLAASSTKPGQLDGIAVGIGPGSYTGIRIAVTAAKTLAWAWDIPVAGVSSLQALAWGGWHSGLAAKAQAAADDAAAGAGGTPSADQGGTGAASVHWIVPLVDARRGQAYTALFASAGGDAPRRLAPDAIRQVNGWLEELAARLTEAAPEERPAAVWIVGETGQHAAAAAELRCPAGTALQLVPYELEGRWIGRLGAEALLAGQRDDVHALVPNYTQLSEAEANLLRKG
ncbi:tRNA (adenosine(37)-N6)-threonylcarbamoyltransferase complex dimerization subunit type 1 TsaB [Paenibacillus amylolyticus]|uniref:tRNA (adenosine(37)-N6)-threonylcarbamoyltransferase complex dimerization subunit type 1 TsaB n=1 Tax=Paenibacillus amylolyticus TaxID=1451 RepID=UPI0023D8FC59|nr:tRNA (adenosine(37)-N6)-threonylcarbamoyltransferase complex dimerization subunit type 1 TsaB [Paenibacillus amylolyticus]